MLRLEIPSYGIVQLRNRVWIVTLVGLMLGAGTLGYWIGNGETTLNSIAHVSDTLGKCDKTVHILKTTQVDNDKLTNPLSGAQTKLPEAVIPTTHHH